MDYDNRPIDKKKLAVLRYYEDVLLGCKSNLQKEEMCNIALPSEVVKYCCDYALLDLCNFSADQAWNYFDDALAKQLSVNKIYPLIQSDKKTTSNKNNNMEFILSIVYPEKFKYDLYTHAVDEYERVNHLGKYYSADTHKFAYAKDFFTGPDADYNFGVCLFYCIERKLSHMTLEELYFFFANEDNAKEFLKKCNIPDVTSYDTVLDFFHATTPDADEFYYHAALIKVASDVLESQETDC